MAKRPLSYDVADGALIAARILIASYFVAMASGLIASSSFASLTDPLLAPEQSAHVSSGIVYLLAFAIMVGRFTRGAALVLALYVLWSSLAANVVGGETVALGAFWQDVAMTASLLLISLTQPRGNQGLRLFSRKVMPRRIDSAGRPRAQRPLPVRRDPLPAAEPKVADEMPSGLVFIDRARRSGSSVA